MHTGTPIDRQPGTVTLGRGWALPAVVIGAIIAGSYLPAHGVSGLVSILAATVAALGLAGISIAAPRCARAIVLGRLGSVPLVGSAPVGHAGPDASPQRQIAAVAVGTVVSATLAALSSSLLLTDRLLPSGHAVLLIALFANIALLLSNVVPMPPWPGWTLLQALVERRDDAKDQRVDRVVRLARVIIVGEAGVLAALGIGVGDWLVLFLAAILVWQGWMQTTVAKADATIDHFLAARRVGDLAREFSTTADGDEPAIVAIARRASEQAVIAVQDGETFLGAIGPRQASGVGHHSGRQRCSDVMVSLEQMELLRADAPATSLLAQLHRYGFALVFAGSELRYVEVSDVIQRILVTAAVAQAASTHHFP